MLFTAPAFAFLFLPMSIIFYIIFAKKHKRNCFLLISIAYYFVLNMSAPLNMLWLPLLVAYTFAAYRIAERVDKKPLTVALCCVPIMLLIALRTIAYLELDGFVYPVGLLFPTLCTVSYICECKRDADCPRDILSLMSYLCFFPLMILGPFVKYTDFCHLTSEENIDFGLSSIADGVRLYAIGFVKRIAVGAVLVDGYQSIFTYSWDAPSFITIVLLLLLIYFGVFFSISGYYDMGVGIARMFGIAVAEVNVNPLSIATPNEYSTALFGSVRSWSKSYVIEPLCEGRSKAPSSLLKIAVYCVATVLLIRSEPMMLLLSIPLIAFSLASSRLKLDVAKYRIGPRLLCGTLTVLVVGAFWVFVTIGDGSILEYLSEMSEQNAEYQTDMLLISFSWIKYLLVALLGACTIIPRTATAKRLTERLSTPARWVRDYGSMLIMLVIFVFTALFFLPQFEMYNYVPFNYIFV